jgi:hypothetical protein
MHKHNANKLDTAVEVEWDFGQIGNASDFARARKAASDMLRYYRVSAPAAYAAYKEVMRDKSHPMEGKVGYDATAWMRAKGAASSAYTARFGDPFAGYIKIKPATGQH